MNQDANTVCTTMQVLFVAMRVVVQVVETLMHALLYRALHESLSFVFCLCKKNITHTPLYQKYIVTLIFFIKKKRIA